MNAEKTEGAPLDGLQETWRSRLLYTTTRIISQTAFVLAFSHRAPLARHCPKTGPVLIIANHESYLDPPAIGLAFQRPLIYLARKTLFKNPYFGAFIRGLNAVPIDQDGIGKEGLRTILDQLRLGKPVLVFPEGTRTPDGTLQPLRPGIHLLIKKTNAPILPVGIAGAYDAWPVWRKYPIPSPLFLPATPRTIAVHVGEPLDPAPYAAMPRDEAMLALQAELAKVKALAEKLRRK